MNFFDDSDITRAKNKAYLEKTHADQEKLNRENEYIRLLQPIYDACLLFREMAKEIPGIALRFGVNPERLFLHKSRFKTHYTDLLYRLPVRYDHEWVCVDTKGELFVYKTPVFGFEKECTIQRMSITMDDIKKVIHRSVVSCDFYANSYGGRYPYELIAVMALCCYECEVERGTTSSDYYRAEKLLNADIRLSNVKEFILYSLTHYNDYFYLYNK